MAAFQQVNIFNHNSESWTSCTVSEKVSELLSSEMEMFDWLCVSEYFNHLNSRLDVAELNGAKFYGTAHGTSSPHTHARTHINDTLPYGMLVQPKHPSWLTCLPQRVLSACVLTARAKKPRMSRLKRWAQATERKLGIKGIWVLRSKYDNFFKNSLTLGAPHLLLAAHQVDGKTFGNKPTGSRWRGGGHIIKCSLSNLGIIFCSTLEFKILEDEKLLHLSTDLCWCFCM